MSNASNPIDPTSPFTSSEVSAPAPSRSTPPSTPTSTASIPSSPSTLIDQERLSTLIAKGKMHFVLREWHVAYASFCEARRLLLQVYGRKNPQCYDINYFMAVSQIRMGVFDYTSRQLRFGKLQRYFETKTTAIPEPPKNIKRTTYRYDVNALFSKSVAVAVKLLDEAYAICDTQPVDAEWGLKKANVLFQTSIILNALNLRQASLETLEEVLALQRKYVQANDLRLGATYAAMTFVINNKNYGVDVYHEITAILEERRDRIINCIQHPLAQDSDVIRGTQELETIQKGLNDVCAGMVLMILPHMRLSF